MVIIMQFKLTMQNNEFLTFDQSTIFRAANSLAPENEPNKDLFYMQLAVENSFDNISANTPSFGTSDPYLGICGVLGKTDFFQIEGDESWYSCHSVIKVTIED